MNSPPKIDNINSNYQSNPGLKKVGNDVPFPWRTEIQLIPLVAAVDLIAAAKSSLQGELRWEFCAPIRTGDGLLLLQLLPLACPPKLTAAMELLLELLLLDPLFPEPFVGCGKYPPGEGSPSGPRPGLRLRTRPGGLHL